MCFILPVLNYTICVLKINSLWKDIWFVSWLYNTSLCLIHHMFHLKSGVSSPWNQFSFWTSNDLSCLHFNTSSYFTTTSKITGKKSGPPNQTNPSQSLANPHSVKTMKGSQFFSNSFLKKSTLSHTRGAKSTSDVI